jgi:hypothetical protein
MPTIDELKGMASSKLGFARSNNYLVELPSLNANPFGRLSGFIPSIPGVTPDSKPSSRELNILCKNATIPGKQITTLDRKIGMRTEKVAYGYAVSEVNLSFYLLNDYGVMNYFDEWRSRILDEDNMTVGYKRDYSFPVKIHQLRRPLINVSKSLGPIRINLGAGGGSVYSVELIDAFPTTINSISFSNDLDGLVEVSVSLSYTNWTRISPSQNFINIDVNPGQLFG